VTETTDNRVFEIIEIAQADENLLKITGLTFKTLRVGDLVHIRDDKKPLVSRSATFDIKRIFVFGREISEVDRGYYIELFVSGGNEDILKDEKYFYLK
jgi:hypothetical protein